MAFIKKINLKGIEYEIHASSADKVAWENITGKPSTFSPSSHTHTKSQITNFPTSMPASDVYSWAKASTKPSYSWSEITSKPSTFTPASHTHTIANITNLQSTLDGKVPTSRTVNGKALSSNISLTASDVGAASSSHTHNYAGSSSAGGGANSLASQDHLTTKETMDNFLTASQLKFATFKLSEDTDNLGFANNDGMLLSLPWNSTSYGGQIAFDDTGGNIAYRGKANSWSSWYKLIHSGNIGSQSVASATKLTTSAGSATQPVYFSDGKPVKTTYTLGASVPSGAKFTDTVYTHPTTSGNKHIPSGGSSGQILRWSADGTAVWGADNNTTYSNATTSVAGLMSASDKSKLDGITSSADSVSFSRSLTSGTKVGTITINGTGTDIYAPTNTDTHYTTGLKVGASATATANAKASNGSVYLNVLDNTTVRDSHKIVGSGATTVTSDANGVITISSTDNNTTYSAATTSTAGLMSASDKSKLDGIATEANKYTHPTTSGNKHIPSGGGSGKILRWSSDGTAAWGENNDSIKYGKLKSNYTTYTFPQVSDLLEPNWLYQFILCTNTGNILSFAMPYFSSTFPANDAGIRLQLGAGQTYGEISINSGKLVLRSESAGIASQTFYSYFASWYAAPLMPLMYNSEQLRLPSTATLTGYDPDSSTQWTMTFMYGDTWEDYIASGKNINETDSLIWDDNGTLYCGSYASVYYSDGNVVNITDLIQPGETYYSEEVY